MGQHRTHPLTQRQEVATAGGLVAILVFAAYSWFVAPHLASLQASQRYERAAGLYAEKSRAVNQMLHTERTRLQELAGQYAQFSNQAFRPDKAEEFLSDLEAFCEQTGCVMASLSHSRDDGRSPARRPVEARRSLFAHRSVALTVHAGYGNVIRLIERLQARRQKVWIDALRMGPSDLRPDWVACDMVITIHVNLDTESPDDEQAPMQP